MCLYKDKYIAVESSERGIPFILLIGLEDEKITKKVDTNINYQEEIVCIKEIKHALYG